MTALETAVSEFSEHGRAPAAEEAGFKSHRLVHFGASASHRQCGFKARDDH